MSAAGTGLHDDGEGRVGEVVAEVGGELFAAAERMEEVMATRMDHAGLYFGSESSRRVGTVESEAMVVEAEEKQRGEDGSGKRGTLEDANRHGKRSSEAKAFFIEYLPWIGDEEKTNFWMTSGSISCPNCKVELGRRGWDTVQGKGSGVESYRRPLFAVRRSNV